MRPSTLVALPTLAVLAACLPGGAVPGGGKGPLAGLFDSPTSAGPTRALPPPDQQVVPAATPNTYAWKPLIPKAGSMVLIDKETRSIFNLRGEAIAGPLAERKLLLPRWPATTMYWFAFSVFFPGAEIWGRAERLRDSGLSGEKTGQAGCFGGQDCIPSLPDTGPPKGDLAWNDAQEAEASYLKGDDLVVGVFMQGVARAYPHKVLWWHEIANDHIGDKRFTVSYCPLTGSAVVWDATSRGLTFGVSGNLFNSNLVMYDHQTGALWPQLWGGAVSGDEGRAGTWLTPLPHTETTWAAWRTLHPDTLALSQDTGYSRNYLAYPYGTYRTDDDNTFRQTDPPPDKSVRGKAATLVLFDRAAGKARGYVYADLETKVGETAVVNDTFAGQPVAVAFEAESQLAVVFDPRIPGRTLELEAGAFDPGAVGSP